MSISEKIDQDLKQGMLTKKEEQVSVLRLLKSAIKNAEIFKKEPLTDTEVLNVLEKQAKQRLDSAEQYTNGNRPELAAKEMSEYTLIETYLPAKMSADDLDALVVEVIGELGASSLSDMGQVMKAVMAKSAGTADGKAVSEIVRKKLS
jgi:hypothetical protein